MSDIGKPVRVRLSDELSDIVIELYEQARKWPGGEQLTFDAFMTGCLVVGVASAMPASRDSSLASGVIETMLEVSSSAESARRLIGFGDHVDNSDLDTIRDIARGANRRETVTNAMRSVAPKRSS